MRNAVNTAQVTLAEINQARDKIKNVKEKPSDALYLLRIAAKSYVQGIPFAQWGVDKAFDSVEATIDAHRDEAKVIIEDLSRRMGDVVEKHKQITAPAAWELVKVVTEETGRLKEVAVKAAKEHASGEGAGKVRELVSPMFSAMAE
jgi:dissimilatory sulfite reductase (desulfoviridin) alpha/beta subunit